LSGVLRNILVIGRVFGISNENAIVSKVQGHFVLVLGCLWSESNTRFALMNMINIFMGPGDKQRSADNHQETHFNGEERQEII